MDRHWDISGTTSSFFLIGLPTHHSLSPALHNTSFELLDIDARYLCADVHPEHLESAIAGMPALNIAGFNVTMPHKQAVIPHLDSLSREAELMGAVNTVKNSGGKLVGYNTDGAGLMRAIAEAGRSVAGSKILVIGTGGAGRAAYTQAYLDQASRVCVAKLHREGLESVAEHLSHIHDSSSTSSFELMCLEDREHFADEVATADIIIDATRSGMAPYEEESNIPAEWIEPHHLVVETVYHPRETRLLREAHQRGASCVDGLGMLLWQAAIAEEHWLGIQMPVAEVRERVFSSY